MIEVAKAIACMYTSIVVAQATEITFNGCNNTTNEYLDFIQGSGFNTIAKIEIKKEAMNLNKEITLKIPAAFKDKYGMLTRTFIEEKAFKDLQLKSLRLKIKFIEGNDKYKYVQIPQNCSEMFAGSDSITEIDLRGVDSSCVTNAWRMFWGCSGLESIIFGTFNTANIKSMEAMFMGCSELKNLDLTNFNTENVETMQSMFNFCLSLEQLDLCNFDTKKVTNMSYMFRG